MARQLEEQNSKAGAQSRGLRKRSNLWHGGSLWYEGLVKPLGVESIKRVIEASQMRITCHSPSAVARPSRCLRLARIMHTESAGSGGKWSVSPEVETRYTA